MKILGGRYLDERELGERGIKSVGEKVMVHETAILVDLDNIELGSNLRIGAFCILSAAGGHIRIGDHMHIAAHRDLFGARGIDMADFSGLSQTAKIYSAGDDYSGAGLTNPTVPREYVRTIGGAVRLGRHVIIGSGTVILPGVEIGDGVSVGALSLVTKSLEDEASIRAFRCGASRAAAKRCSKTSAGSSARARQSPALPLPSGQRADSSSATQLGISE